MELGGLQETREGVETGRVYCQRDSGKTLTAAGDDIARLSEERLFGGNGKVSFRARDLSVRPQVSCRSLWGETRRKKVVQRGDERKG